MQTPIIPCSGCEDDLPAFEIYAIAVQHLFVLKKQMTEAQRYYQIQLDYVNAFEVEETEVDVMDSSETEDYRDLEDEDKPGCDRD